MESFVAVAVGSFPDLAALSTAPFDAVPCAIPSRKGKLFPPPRSDILVTDTV